MKSDVSSKLITETVDVFIANSFVMQCLRKYECQFHRICEKGNQQQKKIKLKFFLKKITKTCFRDKKMELLKISI